MADTDFMRLNRFGRNFAKNYRGPLHKRVYDFAARQWHRPIVQNTLFPETGMQPMEWFGFTRHGANRELAFAGVRVGRRAGPRFWVPDPNKPWANAGSWGNWSDLKGAWKSTLAGAETASGKFMRGAKFVGGRLIWPVLGLMEFGSSFSRYTARGDNILVAGAKATASVAANAIMWTVGMKMLTNPITLAAAIPLAIGVGHIQHQNKMAEYSKRVKRTEFVGDMSAFNTRAASTMRQRSMQSIERSYLGARSVLGSEAQYRHMSQSRAFSANPAVWGRMV